MEFDLGKVLTALSTHGVEFMVVGGVAAVLRGAPIVTQDVNILYKIDEGNIAKLKAVLDQLEVLGMSIRVLELRRLVELKRVLGRPKDLAALPVLEATLREQERTDSE